MQDPQPHSQNKPASNPGADEAYAPDKAPHKPKTSMDQVSGDTPPDEIPEPDEDEL